MKKSLIALAALATVATAAQAQSSVTLYGIIDNGVAYQSGFAAGSKTFGATGAASTSRWGLRGEEDLGGGLKATMNVEGGLLTNTGANATSNVIFDRAAVVGLAGKFGSVKVGRQNTIAYDNIASFDPMGAGNVGGVVSTADATAVTSNNNVYNMYLASRWDNAIQYQTPTFNGLTGNVQYRFGGASGSTNYSEAWAAGLKYEAGNLRLAATYIEQNASSSATNGVAAGGRLNSGYQYLASYNFGIATGIVGYTVTEGYGTAASAGKYQVTFAGAIIPVTAALTARIYYADVDNKATGKNPHQAAAGLFYAFSKRTTAYGLVANSQQDGNSQLGTTVTSTLGSAAEASKNQTAWAVGIRHAF